ncbi:transporter [Aquabacterium sp. A3]|uniref:SphA family protein n=1 Tax=Aquabacterium sp. A3 TaxID=3132829 RepID=UPI003119BB8D
MSPQRLARVSLAVSPVRLAACALAASLVSVSAGAAENGGQRYSAGIGGSDMTAPLMPGWYFQAPVVAYHAKKIKGDNGKQATYQVPPSPPFVPAFTAALDIDTNVRAVQPRITYLDNTRLWGANIGFTMMLPIVQRHADFSLTAPAGAFGPFQSTVQAGLDAQAAQISGHVSGIGDFEMGGILHWELADNQAMTLVTTFVVPTGDYQADRRLNPGFGNFYTFRPSLQYSYIGDGWDFGMRGVLSFNTRNKETGYRSGNVANVDFQLMTFVSEDIRVGLQGFAVKQFQNDSQDVSYLADPSDAATITNGNRMRAYGLGPAIGWLKDGGDMMVEGKFIKEFGARNRTEGQAFWLTISKPLGL